MYCVHTPHHTEEQPYRTSYSATAGRSLRFVSHFIVSTRATSFAVHRRHSNTTQFPDHYFIPCSASSSSSWLVSKHIRQKHHFLALHVSRVLFNSPQCLNYIYRPSVCCCCLRTMRNCVFLKQHRSATFVTTRRVPTADPNATESDGIKIITVRKM